MSLVLDIGLTGAATIPPATVYAYNRWHHSTRAGQHVETLQHIEALETELGIGRTAREVIADIAQKLADDDYRRNPDHFLRPMRLRLPRSSPEVASPASEVAWRNGVYVRSGRYPTQEEYREWLVGR